MEMPPEEIEAIGYLLESLDAELSEMQTICQKGTENMLGRGYIGLAMTLQEITAKTIEQRLMLIGWGLSMGLIGENAAEVLDIIEKQGVNPLPYTHHEKLKKSISDARKLMERNNA